MNPQLLVILVGLFYILIVGGNSLLRREGLSGQFAVESLTITGLALVVGAAVGTPIHPIFLFILLYLVTMRARLLTDLANVSFGRRGYATAEKLYRLALRLFPDRTSRFIVCVNWSIARLHDGDVEGAVTGLEDVLAEASEKGGLGRKYEAACRYNLAVAYRKAEHHAEAVRLFNQVVELFPGSVYGRAAEKALQERRKRGSSR